MKRKPKPRPMTPGSPLAVLNGCACSPLANNYGAGHNGKYAISPGCPMHKTQAGSREQCGLELAVDK